MEERIQGELAEVDSNHRRGEVSSQILSGVEGFEGGCEVEDGVSHNRCRHKRSLIIMISITSFESGRIQLSVIEFGQ